MEFSGLFAKYRLREPRSAQAQELSIALGTSAVFSELLAQRGVTDKKSLGDFLEPSLAEISDPTMIVDSESAAQRLAHAIEGHERVVIYGDYDVDGTTAAAILSEVLERLGAEVRVVAADRFAGGYGLSQAALQRCLESKPSVLVTCDCGSSDHERIAQAKKLGVDVIVIDHHLVPEEKLPAFAFLNPRRPDCPSVYKDFVSAGLAFVMGAAVRRVMNRDLDMRSWLDLVALGTIADVAPLQGDNRRLVRAGLGRLASRDARPGIVALRELSKLSGGFISASDVGFRLAPRINAAGRLGSSQIALDLLRSRSLAEARMLAAKLEQLNNQRKELTESATREAIAQIQKLYGGEPQAGVVAAADHWHPGVLGIVAARLVEQFGVSAIVCSMHEGSYRGSARAAVGADVHQALSAMQEQLSHWGGHKAAAGLEFTAERLQGVRESFSENSKCAIKDKQELLVDAYVSGPNELPRFNELKQLEPLGEGNPTPIFALAVSVDSVRPVGTGEHLSVALNIGTTRLRGFAPKLGKQIQNIERAKGFIGELRPTDWQGREQIELLIRDVY